MLRQPNPRRPSHKTARRNSPQHRARARWQIPSERASRAMTIHLGYEVGTGKPVEIPLAHLAVTGQTQQSGKTTTREALITRAKLPAIAFITKRGEGVFATGRRIPPYFRERADWQFVSS